MNNRIAVFGGKMFEEVNYNAGNYSINTNSYLKMLHAFYDVNNFSYDGLTAYKSSKLLKSLIKNNAIYDMCIISLGEVENELDEFNYNLDNMLSILHDKKIKTILIASLESPKVYNDEMKKLANVYDFEFIENLVEKNSKKKVSLQMA